MSTPLTYTRGQRQRGAVVILFGLTVVVLIGFIGLAVDLGRFFVIKTELQNAMDACALSAASQLRPGSNTQDDLIRAVAYGRVFTTGGKDGNDAIKNKANFQSTTVNLADSDITFAGKKDPDYGLNGPYASSSTDNLYARYAKCEYPLSGLPIYFMQVLNAALATQTVSAMAVATKGPQICNIIPVGICPRTGIQVGDWLELGDGTGSSARGWFRWVQFDGVSGAKAVRDHLLNAGACNIPTLVETKSGNVDIAKQAWNTRFGIYEGGYGIATAPPDKTGYSFFNHSVLPVANQNWPLSVYPDINPGTLPRALPTFNAGETSPNFWNFADSFTVTTAPLPGSGHTATDPQIFSGKPTIATNGANGTHNALGLLNRRLVIVARMQSCSDGSPIQATEKFGCALMLNPFGKVGSNDINGKIEYLGPIGAGSPCGDGKVLAPNLSVLVK